MHDILCFANTIHDKDCYLIIGVLDTGEIVSVGEENRRKQVDILDLLSNTVSAGDNIPEVRLDTIDIEGKEIDVLTIFNSYTVPYYLKTKCKKYNNIREGYIYTRYIERGIDGMKNFGVIGKIKEKAGQLKKEVFALYLAYNMQKIAGCLYIVFWNSEFVTKYGIIVLR